LENRFSAGQADFPGKKEAFAKKNYFTGTREIFPVRYSLKCCGVYRSTERKVCQALFGSDRCVTPGDFGAAKKARENRAPFHLCL
jgi:hypothetical protein